MKPLSLFSQFSNWDWYRPVKTRLFFILRHCKSSTLLFSSWMSAVRVLIWPDSVTGCITGWTTGFSSSFLILVSWWIMFLVLCLIWDSAWSNKLLTPWQLFSHYVSFLRKLVTLSSRDLTLAETARKSAFMSFSHIFLHLYHSIVDLCDDCKDQTEYGVIIRRFNDFPTFFNDFWRIAQWHPYKEFDWLKRQVNSSNLLRTAGFTTWVQSSTSYYTVVSSFLQ
jgi:hypothetical protein